MVLCYRVTFTRVGHKHPRNRKFLDGFLTHSGRDAKLLDESGGVVALGRLPDGVPLEPGAELEKGFGQGIIVHVDEPCATCEIGGGASLDATAAAAPTKDSEPPPAAAAPARRAQPSFCTGIRGSGASGGRVGIRPAFKAPRPVQALAAPGAEHQQLCAAPSVPHGQANAAVPQPQHRRAFQAPPRLPRQAPPAAHAPAPTTALPSGGCCSLVCVWMACSRLKQPSP
jgi:hypothetical protein